LIYILIPVAAVLLFIFLCIYINPGPKVKPTAKNAWLAKAPIAHRGLHSDDAEVPENSMKAFSKAIAQGYGIEIDVQLSADGQVIVFHDYSLQRMTGLDTNTASLTWAELKELRLMGSNQRIPLLKELLELVDGQVPLLIEVKNEGSVGPLEQALIDTLKDYNGEFAIQAFNPFVLQYVKKHAPDFLRRQLSGSFAGEDLPRWKKFLLRTQLLNGLSSPSFVSYETDALPKWLARRLKSKGLYLLTWTVRDMETYTRHMEIFDNVIFEGCQPPLNKMIEDEIC